MTSYNMNLIHTLPLFFKDYGLEVSINQIPTEFKIEII